MVGGGDAKATGAYADPIPSPWAFNLRRDGVEDRDRLLMAIYAEFEGKTTVSALAGLAKSIRAAGLGRRKIGFDDPRVGSWLQQEGLRDISVYDAANTKALRIVYDAIHPGMTFAESSKIMRDVMQQEGFDRGGGGAHPVGLEHTDQPWPTGAERSPSEIYTNLVYEENVVFTMDVPYHEVGYGTSHVEDMMVVKKNRGCEGLSSMDTRLIVRPA